VFAVLPPIVATRAIAINRLGNYFRCYFHSSWLFNGKRGHLLRGSLQFTHSPESEKADRVVSLAVCVLG
jgi:hypothetical protein